MEATSHDTKSSANRSAALDALDALDRVRRLLRLAQWINEAHCLIEKQIRTMEHRPELKKLMERDGISYHPHFGDEEQAGLNDLFIEIYGDLRKPRAVVQDAFGFSDDGATVQ